MIVLLPNKSKPPAMVSSCRVSVSRTPGIAKSRNNGLCWAFAPASDSTWTHARSRLVALRLSQPDLVHERRWCPNSSRDSEQALHLALARGRGRNIRLRRTSKNKLSASLNQSEVGIASNQSPAPTPDCERSIACWLGLSCASRTFCPRWHTSRVA